LARTIIMNAAANQTREHKDEQDGNCDFLERPPWCRSRRRGTF
jgi:hypothetical protein